MSDTPDIGVIRFLGDPCEVTRATCPACRRPVYVLADLAGKHPAGLVDSITLVAEAGDGNPGAWPHRCTTQPATRRPSGAAAGDEPDPPTGPA